MATKYQGPIKSFYTLKEFYNFLKQDDNTPTGHRYVTIVPYIANSSMSNGVLSNNLQNLFSQENLRKFQLCIQSADLPNFSLSFGEIKAELSTSTPLGIWNTIENTTIFPDKKEITFHILDTMDPIIENFLYPWFIECLQTQNSNTSYPFPRLNFAFKYFREDQITENMDGKKPNFIYWIDGAYPIYIEACKINHGKDDAGDIIRAVRFSFNMMLCFPNETIAKYYNHEELFAGIVSNEKTSNITSGKDLYNKLTSFLTWKKAFYNFASVLPSKINKSISSNIKTSRIKSNITAKNITTINPSTSIKNSLNSVIKELETNNTTSNILQNNNNKNNNKEISKEISENLNKLKETNTNNKNNNNKNNNNKNNNNINKEISKEISKEIFENLNKLKETNTNNKNNNNKNNNINKEISKEIFDNNNKNNNNKNNNNINKEISKEISENLNKLKETNNKKIKEEIIIVEDNQNDITNKKELNNALNDLAQSEQLILPSIESEKNSAIKILDSINTQKVNNLKNNLQNENNSIEELVNKYLASENFKLTYTEYSLIKPYAIKQNLSTAEVIKDIKTLTGESRKELLSNIIAANTNNTFSNNIERENINKNISNSLISSSNIEKNIDKSLENINKNISNSLTSSSNIKRNVEKTLENINKNISNSNSLMSSSNIKRNVEKTLENINKNISNSLISSSNIEKNIDKSLENIKTTEIKSTFNSENLNNILNKILDNIMKVQRTSNFNINDYQKYIRTTLELIEKKQSQKLNNAIISIQLVKQLNSLNRKQEKKLFDTELQTFIKKVTEYINCEQFTDEV